MLCNKIEWVAAIEGNEIRNIFRARNRKTSYQLGSFAKRKVLNF